MALKHTYSKAGKKEADKAVRFMRSLTHTKGRWAGQPFNLLPWQEHEVIRPLFGVLTDGGLRRYRTVYMSVAKKNGKSEMAGGVGLKLFAADREPAAEVYSAAADREQASIISTVATRMVKGSKGLSSKCRLIESRKRITYPSTGSVYVTLSAEVSTKHGPSPHGILFDELHAQKTRELYDTLTFGSGAARSQPVLFITTTAGYDRNSICWEVHEYALRVLKGLDPENWSHVPGAPIEDPTFLPIVYAVPEDADWTDEKLWPMANPSLGAIFDMDNLRQDFRGAEQSVAKENNFRRFRLNQWVKQSVRWMNMSAWDACNLGKLKTRHVRGRPCWVALDLSSNRDVTAMVSVFEPDDDGDPYDVVCRFFIPEDNIEERVNRDHVPYDQWVRDGFITATPGNVVDYRYIVRALLDWGVKVDVREVPYDRWGAAQIIIDLEDEGVTVVPFGQGFSAMSQPTKDLETLVLSRRLNHQGNPVLRWMADNCVVQTDAAGNIKIDKKKSTERVDGMVALVMALGRAMLGGGTSGHSIYETQEPLALEIPV